MFQRTVCNTVSHIMALQQETSFTTLVSACCSQNIQTSIQASITHDSALQLQPQLAMHKHDQLLLHSASNTSCNAQAWLSVSSAVIKKTHSVRLSIGSFAFAWWRKVASNLRLSILVQATGFAIGVHVDIFMVVSPSSGLHMRHNSHVYMVCDSSDTRAAVLPSSSSLHLRHNSDVYMVCDSSDARAAVLPSSLHEVQIRCVHDGFTCIHHMQVRMTNI